MRVLIFSPQFEKGAFELLQKDLACSLNKFGVNLKAQEFYNEN